MSTLLRAFWYKFALKKYSYKQPKAQHSDICVPLFLTHTARSPIQTTMECLMLQSTCCLKQNIQSDHYVGNWASQRFVQNVSEIPSAVHFGCLFILYHILEIYSSAQLQLKIYSLTISFFNSRRFSISNFEKILATRFFTYP